MLVTLLSQLYLNIVCNIIAILESSLVVITGCCKGLWRLEKNLIPIIINELRMNIEHTSALYYLTLYN